MLPSTDTVAPEASATAGAPTTLTDTSDMYCVHGVFRDALDGAPALLASADAGRVGTIAEYYDVVLHLLELHHEGEDELLTPLLVQRCTGDDLATVTRVAEQHGSVSSLLGGARSRVTQWRAAPDPQSAAALREALAEVQQALVPHLDEEERLVLPIAARHVTPEEWGQLPGHALRQFEGSDLWVVLGQVFDHMSDEQRAEVQAHMPPPLLAAWTEHGRPYYESFTARLNG